MLEAPLVKKIIEKNPLKNKLSPAAQDTFLSLVTLEGSIAAVVLATEFTVSHVPKLAALPAASFLTLGTIGTAALTGWVAALGVWCAYDAVCCVKTLSDIYKKHRHDKKAARTAEKTAEVAIIPPQQKTKTQPDFSAKTAAAFNTESARKDQVQVATQVQVSTPSARPSP